MKLRNKKTGEIIDVYKGQLLLHYNNGRKTIHFKSLEELEEWEDYEPKDHWYINYQGEVYVLDPNAVPEYSRNAKEIGNYFETKEEAEKAVEKLKAWQRLKDNGFEFVGFYGVSKCIDFENDDTSNTEWVKENEADLDLLFGGKK